MTTVIVLTAVIIAPNPSLPEKPVTLFFVKITADVAANVQGQSLDPGRPEH